MKSKRRAVTLARISSSRSLLRYRKVLAKLLQGSSSAYSWAPSLSEKIQKSDWPGLYAWADSVTAEAYHDAAEYYAASQIAALLLKYPRDHRDLGLTTSPRDAAVNKFKLAEEKCKLVNKRFRTLGCRWSSYRGKLEYMKSWIARTLGESPDLREIYGRCGFSSGAAIGVHGNATNIFRKLFSDSWTVTPCAKQLAYHALWSQDQFLLSFMDEKNGYICYDIDVATERMSSKCEVVPYNKVSFVPKTAKTHRSIAVEPLLNSYLQKGIDQVLRDRLRKVGYDLSDQAKNQSLAKSGSIGGHLATVDLSSASDTISRELVRFLLPSDWYDLLDQSRSRNYLLDGEVHHYEKFASMGNGFCFPLETVIFIAAVRASIHFSESEDKTHSVYGDDIIIPIHANASLKSLLGYCGFTVNRDKTFSEGPFRESCGADWYRGQDVRPVYLDYLLSDNLRLQIFHNATLRGDLQSDFFQEVREMIRSWVPFRQRLMRPLWSQHNLANHSSFEMKMKANGAFSVPMDVFMTCRYSWFDKSIWNWRWKELLALPRPDSGTGESYHRARYLSLLLGSPEGKLNLRHTAELIYKNK